MNSSKPQIYTLGKSAYDAVIFDLDGVITKTASLHAAAWKRMFDGYLQQRAEQTGEPFLPFTDEDYRRYVDGKPRYQGVASFLDSRGIELPFGEPSDPPERETVTGLGNRKNDFFQEELRKRNPEVFESSLRLLRALRERGFKIGLVSSSKNTVPIIEAVGITDCFDAQVDGLVIEQINLPGKPAPEAYLLAADELGVAPARAVVVEDAASGVEAGRRGGFGLVIGVAREDNEEDLLSSGAHVVVADLAEIGIEDELLPARVKTVDLPSALEHYGEIAAMLKDRKLALFLDYDGTLTPIVRRPEEALLADEMRQALRRLAEGVPIAIISGRDQRDVRNLVGLEEVYYAGSHGFDIAGPAGQKMTLQKGTEYLPALDKAERILGEKLAGLAGVRLERKRFALAVHFREAAATAADKVEKIVDATVADQPRLRKSGGKKIFELRPAMDWDKGRAIAWLLVQLALDRPEVLPCYLGDDLTDEDAFRELRSRGLGIVVRDGAPRDTAARYALAGPEEVHQFLVSLRATIFEEGS